MLTRSQKDMLAAKKLMENVMEQYAAEAGFTKRSLDELRQERDELVSRFAPLPQPLTPAIPESPEDRAKFDALLTELKEKQ